MKFRRIHKIVLALLSLFTAVYIAGAVNTALRDDPVATFAGAPAALGKVAIFGASGTAGDGILKAAMAAPEIEDIHVFTRRVTPRMEEGIATGKVQVTMHMDYLDYAPIEDHIAAVDAVFWAIGISALGVDEETYGMIHTDFPLRFIETWTRVSEKSGTSFHFISSSDISEDSRTMWVREKIRAEKTLFGFAAGTRLRVIAYRPDYIGPTAEEAHIGQSLLYGFFAPVGAAVKAGQIGQAMIEVTARGSEFENGARVGTRNIRRYSDAYERRLGITD